MTTTAAPQSVDRERGAVSVLVALLMVVVLGMAAFAVDVALVYSERTQLRNGADAGALAIAQKCARDPADPYCTGSALAADLANRNALDASSHVKDITFGTDGTGAHKVTVTTGALEAGGSPNHVSLIFANAVGVGSTEVTASSSAKWGSPVKGTVIFPLTFSICQVQGQVEGAMQLLQIHGKNANPACNYNSSGATVPGGYGWLPQMPGECGADVDIALNIGGSDVGNDGPSHCDALLNSWGADITAGKKVVVLFPVFDTVTGTGSGATYHLVYFAAYDVQGWSFKTGSSLPDSFRNTSAHAGSLACTGSCRGIIGRFVKYVSLDDGYGFGPVSGSSATVVQLTTP